MKVKLLKDARVNALKGATVDVAPESVSFLVSLGIAEVVEEKVVKTEPREVETVEVKAKTEKAVKVTKKK